MEDDKGIASDIEGLCIEIKAAEGEEGERCWTYSETVGQDHDNPTLCARCAKTVKE